MNLYALIFCVGLVLLLLERACPGRALPEPKGWYVRAALLNAAQLGIVLLGGYTWNVWLQGPSLARIDGAMPALAQGFVCWFAGTFVFYWWHRARRIETLTSFYKHPLEIALNSVLSSAVVFVLLGASVEAAGWYSVMAAFGEFYYHMNIRTPRWSGWFLQRPEHHSIHHETGVHHYNYGDITWWDRLFGTFRDTDRFSARCGYGRDREQQLGRMLAFGDVNK